MPFKFCLNTSTIKPQPVLEKIRLAGEAGFAGVELWINDIYEHVGRGGDVSDIEKALDETALVTLGLWFALILLVIMFARLEAETWQQRLSYLLVIFAILLVWMMYMNGISTYGDDQPNQIPVAVPDRADCLVSA